MLLRVDDGGGFTWEGMWPVEDECCQLLPTSADDASLPAIPVAALRRPATLMTECRGGSRCGARRRVRHEVLATGGDRNP